MKYKISILEQSFEIEIGSVSGDFAAVTVDNTPYMVRVENLSASESHQSTTVAHPVATPAPIAPKPLSKQAGRRDRHCPDSRCYPFHQRQCGGSSHHRPGGCNH